ncbi:MAG: hypothetical protein H6648_05395 [Caldilineae bacterium]|nr:hypothetical protein [Caldilineae bacterium]
MLRCELGELEAGEARRLELVFAVDPGLAEGTRLEAGSARLLGAEAEATPDDNEARQLTTVSAMADLAVTWRGAIPAPARRAPGSGGRVPQRRASLARGARLVFELPGSFELGAEPGGLRPGSPRVA